jgi:hypothetical protein
MRARRRHGVAWHGNASVARTTGRSAAPMIVLRELVVCERPTPKAVVGAVDRPGVRAADAFFFIFTVCRTTTHGDVIFFYIHRLPYHYAR